uniref:Uncharacterized protein n=1 Tax=Arundo donax TaxID=35708 RepID=A0A0A9DKM0_ARUDO
MRRTKGNELLRHQIVLSCSHCQQPVRSWRFYADIVRSSTYQANIVRMLIPDCCTLALSSLRTPEVG